MEVDLRIGVIINFYSYLQIAGPCLYFEYAPNSQIIYDPYFMDQEYTITFKDEAFRSLNAKNILTVFNAHIDTN